MHRTFIVHATEAKLPSDLLGLTCVRYDDALTPAAMRVVNQKLGRPSMPWAVSPASRACGGNSP